MKLLHLKFLEENQLWRLYTETNNYKLRAVGNIYGYHISAGIHHSLKFWNDYFQYEEYSYSKQRTKDIYKKFNIEGASDFGFYPTAHVKEASIELLTTSFNRLRTSNLSK